jgi:hypothetical protein
MSTGNRVVEATNAPGDLTALENTLKSATAKAPASTAAPTKNDESGSNAPAPKPDWIQDKFWTGELNESATKQAQAYVSLQSAYGRMANDLGHQRKMTDQILALDKRTTDLDGTKPPVAPKVDARKLVDDPTATLDAYWREREAEFLKKQQAEQQARQAQAEEQAFLGKHADFQTVTSTAEFVSWVRSSPLRTRAAALAGQGNYVVADELLTEYKAVNGQAPAQSADPNRGGNHVVDTQTEAARKVALESAANTGGASASAKGGPIYRRSDLIALKMNKPHVYSDPKFQQEILQAYAEGRVK